MADLPTLHVCKAEDVKRVAFAALAFSDCVRLLAQERQDNALMQEVVDFHARFHVALDGLCAGQMTVRPIMEPPLKAPPVQRTSFLGRFFTRKGKP